MSTSYTKDPDAVLDYIIDWSDWLDSDTINTSSWIIETGIAEDSNSNTTTTATIWLSGGTVNNEYTVTNRIETVGGRTDDRSIIIYVREK